MRGLIGRNEKASEETTMDKNPATLAIRSFAAAILLTAIAVAVAIHSGSSAISSAISPPADTYEASSARIVLAQRCVNGRCF
jgi:hypothetical protein